MKGGCVVKPRVESGLCGELSLPDSMSAKWEYLRADAESCRLRPSCRSDQQVELWEWEKELLSQAPLVSNCMLFHLR